VGKRSTGRQAAGWRSVLPRLLVLVVLGLAAWWFLDRVRRPAPILRSAGLRRRGALLVRDHGQIYDYLKPYSVYGFTTRRSAR